MRLPGGTGAAGVAAAILVIAPSCSGATKAGGSREKHVRVLTLLSLNSDVDPQLQLYASAVARRSRGALQIDIATGHRLGDPNSERDTIRDVQAGKAELAWVGARAWETVGIESFRALVAPLLIDSYALQQRVLSSAVVPVMLDSLRPHGLLGLALLPGPLRRVVGRRPLRNPRDFAGITFSTTPTATARATARALGARPIVQIANFHRVPRGLGGLEAQLTAIAGNEFFREEPYLTANLTLWPRPLVVFANAKVYGSLPSSQRRALREAAHDVLAASTTAAEQEDKTAARQLCRAKAAGVQFDPVVAGPRDLEALRRAVGPVFRSLERDPQTRVLIGRIESLKRRLGAPMARGPGCEGGAGRQATTAAQLRGVYRRHITLAQLSALDHIPAAQELAGNWGDFVLVIDGTHFAFTQQNNRACTWQFGTFSLDKNKIEETYTNGGGVGTNSYNKPGEYFVSRWSLYRGVLTLDPIVPPDVAPSRWTRVSSTPSFDALGKRCPPPRKALP
jgi:TRAP-type C4-dicarboxylate transport system substrate-binding protein